MFFKATDSDFDITTYTVACGMSLDPPGSEAIAVGKIPIPSTGKKFTRDFVQPLDSCSDLPAFSGCVEYSQEAAIAPNNLLKFYCKHEFCTVVAVVKKCNQDSRYRESLRAIRLGHRTPRTIKGFSRDTRKLGHVVKLCYADVCKCLILRCFNTSSSAPPPAKTSPKTTIYGQV